MNIHFTFHPERCVGCGACVIVFLTQQRFSTEVPEKNYPLSILIL